MPEEELTELEDVEVLTVGLVSSGAIGEDFLLLKQNDEGGDNMPEDTQVAEEEPEVTEEEVTEDNDELSEGMVAKLKKLFATKEDVEELVKAEETEDEVEPEVEDEPSEEQPLPDVEKRLAALETRYDERIEKLLNTQGKLQTELGEAKTELAKSKEQVEQERDAREKREFVEKAAEFRALPIDRRELGDKLHAISKAVDEDTFKWLYEVLKASDQQAWAAGLFNEMGTSKEVANDALTKVEKAADEVGNKEALLSLSQAEQEELLDGMPYNEEGRK